MHCVRTLDCALYPPPLPALSPSWQMSTTEGAAHCKRKVDKLNAQLQAVMQVRPTG